MLSFLNTFRECSIRCGLLTGENGGKRGIKHARNVADPAKLTEANQIVAAGFSTRQDFASPGPFHKHDLAIRIRRELNPQNIT
jgi:hypothetical protein